MMDYAYVIEAQGRLDEAEKVYGRLVGLAIANLDEDSRSLSTFRGAWGRTLFGLERFAEAEPVLLARFEQRRRAYGPDHRRTRSTIRHLIDLYEEWGKPQSAATYRAMLEESDP